MHVFEDHEEGSVPGSDVGDQTGQSRVVVRMQHAGFIIGMAIFEAEQLQQVTRRWAVDTERRLGDRRHRLRDDLRVLARGSVGEREDQGATR